MKLTSKGQVTIPRLFRDKHGLTPQTEVIFESTPDGVLIRPARTDRRQKLEKWAKRVRGSATSGQTTDDLMRLTRGED